ncbi:MAG TPA: hypothetical protein VNL92_03240 [Dehalococcoidia bacterium]|nr:hypothetical protein [Dehalococcoidia bacterium]
MAKDPVCGAEVDEARVNQQAGTVQAGAPQTDPVYGTKRFHEGTWYYFCSLACRQKFMASPGQYVTPSR